MGYTHGTVWTKDLIAQKIRETVKALKLSSMPTRKQFVKYYGDDKLTDKISKTLGYYGWAKELDLPIQSNDTLKGKISEKYAADLLNNRGYETLQMAQNYPYDLLVNHVVKVDVKYSNLYHGRQGNFYSYALRKKYPTCDIYMLIANSDSGEKKIYILPSKDAIQLQIGIGEYSSIYDKYLNRYDIIDQYLKLYSEIA